ncbi:MAG TPA: thioredoxin family protein [Pirellulaceae bacterium]|nr:thioredoxin family protein [Pirellulaceae bacterium]
MTGLAATMLLQAALLTTGAQSYDEAFKEHEASGKPLLVLVGADWCPGCQTMKNGTLARMERAGKLKNVAFSLVNTDQNDKLASRLMRGGSIPQLIMFTKSDKGWDRQQLTGAQSEQAVQQLIGDAVRQAQANQTASDR